MDTSLVSSVCLRNPSELCSECMWIHRSGSPTDKPCYCEHVAGLFQDIQKIWWAPGSCWYLMCSVLRWVSAQLCCWASSHAPLKQPEVMLSHLPSIFLRNIKHNRVIFADSHVKGMVSCWSSPLPQPPLWLSSSRCLSAASHNLKLCSLHDWPAKSLLSAGYLGQRNSSCFG